MAIKLSNVFLYLFSLQFICFSVQAKVIEKIPKSETLKKSYSFHEEKFDSFFQFSFCKKEVCRTLILPSINEKNAADMTTAYFYSNKLSSEWSSDPKVISFYKKNFKYTKCNENTNCVIEYLKKQNNIKILNSRLQGGVVVVGPSGALNIE